MKNKKHDLITNDYENQKQKHLKYLATKSIKKNKIFEDLKNKQINPKTFEDLEF